MGETPRGVITTRDNGGVGARAEALGERVGSATAMLTDLELEVAKLLVTTLRLEEDPAALEPEIPLFVEGLGLDSIDALELSLAISQNYGFEIKSDDTDNRLIFANLRALSGHIEKHRVR